MFWHTMCCVSTYPITRHQRICSVLQLQRSRSRPEG